MKRARTCDVCDFRTNKQSSLERHFRTGKHEKNTRIGQLGFAEPQSQRDLNGPHIYEEQDQSRCQLEPEGRDHLLGLHENNEFEAELNLDIDLDFDEESEEEVSIDTSDQTSTTEPMQSEWFPFRNKTEMLMYILLHSKTHTLSDETIHFIWFIMREAGIDMPTIQSIKNMSFGDLTTDSLLQRGECEDGTPFWFVKPSSILNLSLSHPETSDKLIRYRRISRTAENGFIKEQMDGQKLKNEMKCLSAKSSNTIFYTGDLVMDKRTKRIGKIENFFQDTENNSLLAELRLFDRMEYDQNSLVCCNDVVHADLDYLELSALDLSPENVKFYSFDEENVQLRLVAQEEKQQLIEPNPFKQKNKLVINLPVNIFLDDTSAHRSKKWKPLHCIQQQLSGIPISDRQNTNSIKFIAASTEVPILDMMKAIVDNLEAVKRNGIQVFDAKEKEEVIVTTELAVCVSDFNMMAEATNHMGATTNKFCPRCDADKSTCTNKGIERNPQDTKRILRELTIHNNKEVRQRYGLKPYNNCLWDIINPHRDIPIGILHWMFLGLGKHLLKCCINNMDQCQLQKLQLLIDSADQSSFPSKLSNDLIKYIDSRQGKDIKIYLQIAPFHMKIAGLQDDKVNLLFKLSKICKILVVKKVYKEEDLHELDQKIQNYLESVKEIFPELLQKVKTHLSTHVVDDIRIHGPPSAYQEDAFEKMHGRIRDQLFVQNHHAKSRDTAVSFAEMEIFNHVSTGGYFKMSDMWVQATDKVMDLVKQNEVTDFLGYPRYSRKQQGILIKACRSNTQKIKKYPLLDECEPEFVSACSRYGLELPVDLHVTTAHYKAVTCNDGHIANSGNPVLYQDQDKKCIGIFISGSVINVNGKKLQLAKIKRTRGKSGIQMEGTIINRVEIVPQYTFVKASNLLQNICLIHDCLNALCYSKQCMKTIKVEQETKQLKKLYWVHRENYQVYFVNDLRHSHNF